MRTFIELCTQHRETPSQVPEVLENWVVWRGDEWRFDARQALNGAARTRTQYELFQEWRNGFLRSTTIGEEGLWREALEHSGCDLALCAGDEIPSSDALGVAVSAENMRSAYKSFTLRGVRLIPDRGANLEGLARVVVMDEGVLRFEEGAAGSEGPQVLLNGVRYETGSVINLYQDETTGLLRKLFVAAGELRVLETDIAASWARSWEAVAAHLVWADLRHTRTQVRLRES
jgi:hypothetical protein